MKACVMLQKAHCTPRDSPHGSWQALSARTHLQRARRAPAASSPARSRAASPASAAACASAAARRAPMACMPPLAQCLPKVSFCNKESSQDQTWDSKLTIGAEPALCPAGGNAWHDREHDRAHLHLGQGSGGRGKGLRAQRSGLLLQAHALAALRCSSRGSPSGHPRKHSSYMTACLACTTNISQCLACTLA